MLSDEQVKEVKQEWIEAFDSVSREGIDREGLLAYLEATGFFEAPASTKYNCAFKGGLALHSLNVAKAMQRIAKAEAEEAEGHGTADGNAPFGNDTAVLLGLLHDVFKASMYEECARNEKKYTPYGKKRDELGNFDWVSTKSYRAKEPSERDFVGSAGFSSYYAVSRFVPLTDEETVAIVNQSVPGDEGEGRVPDVYSHHPLAAYLHAADVVATYCVEHD